MSPISQGKPLESSKTTIYIQIKSLDIFRFQVFPHQNERLKMEPQVFADWLAETHHFQTREQRQHNPDMRFHEIQIGFYSDPSSGLLNFPI